MVTNNEEFSNLKVRDLQYDSINGGYYLDVFGKGNKRKQVPLKEKILNSIRMFWDARGLEDLLVAGKEGTIKYNQYRKSLYSFLFISVFNQNDKGDEPTFPFTSIISCWSTYFSPCLCVYFS